MSTQTLPVQKNIAPEELQYKDVRKLIDAGICPDCRSQLTHESGCMTCHVCGFSVC